MLADDKLLVRSDVDKSLRDNCIEATAARIAVVYAYDSKMISLALTDTLVSAHCPRVDQCSTSVSLGAENLLLFRGRLHDVGKFLFLGFQVLVPDIGFILDVSEFSLLGSDDFLGIGNILHCNLLQKVLLLNFLGK